jgi:Nucleoside diphosphate kinase
LIAVHLSGINPSLLTFPSPGTSLTIKMTAEANQERTFIMIKPDGVQRGLVGEILKRFEQKGFKLVAMKFMHVSYNIESFNGLIFRRSLWGAWVF